ncbi:hypothetical protein NQ659_17895, partial [Acinetobacter baumannii]|nr:hypothetical protein [Acinetobacter baumannii]
MMSVALSLSCIEFFSLENDPARAVVKTGLFYAAGFWLGPHKLAKRKKGHHSGLSSQSRGLCLVAGLVHQFVFGNPGHHGTQLAAHLLDGV